MCACDKDIIPKISLNAKRMSDKDDDTETYSTVAKGFEVGKCTFECLVFGSCLGYPSSPVSDPYKPNHVSDSMDAMGLSSEDNANAVDKKYSALFEYFCSLDVDDVSASDIEANQPMMTHICAFPYLAWIPELVWVSTNSYYIDYVENPREYDCTSCIDLFPYDAATDSYADTATVDVGYSNISKTVTVRNEWAPGLPCDIVTRESTYVNETSGVIQSAMSANHMTSQDNVTIIVERFNNMIDYLWDKKAPVTASTYTEDENLVSFLSELPYFPMVAMAVPVSGFKAGKSTFAEAGILPMGNPIQAAQQATTLFSSEIPPCEQSIMVHMHPDAMDDSGDMATLTNEYYAACEQDLADEFEQPNADGECLEYVSGQNIDGQTVHVYPNDDEKSACVANGGTYSDDDVIDDDVINIIDDPIDDGGGGLSRNAKVAIAVGLGLAVVVGILAVLKYKSAHKKSQKKLEKQHYDEWMDLELAQKVEQKKSNDQAQADELAFHQLDG